jgi:hypothetical protein
VIALIRYQVAVLLRSHRWVAPVLGYLVLVVSVGAADAGDQPVRTGLVWSAAMLVPAVAWLTRAVLTAEPSAARACAAAAAGRYRAHLAGLLTVLAGGVALAVAGAVFELVMCKPPSGGIPGRASALAGSLVMSFTCIGVGSAAGVLCNPPVIRRTGTAILGTAGAVIAGLVASVSPANAALRQTRTHAHTPGWPTALPIVVAAILVILSWGLSAVLAARRGDPAPDGGG